MSVAVKAIWSTYLYSQLAPSPLPSLTSLILSFTIPQPPPAKKKVSVMVFSTNSKQHGLPSETDSRSAGPMFPAFYGTPLIITVNFWIPRRCTTVCVLYRLFYTRHLECVLKTRFGSTLTHTTAQHQSLSYPADSSTHLPVPPSLITPTVRSALAGMPLDSFPTSSISLMKQQFVVTHWHTVLQATEKNLTSLPDQHFSTSCFCENIRRNNFV